MTDKLWYKDSIDEIIFEYQRQIDGAFEQIKEKANEGKLPRETLKQYDFLRGRVTVDDP